MRITILKNTNTVRKASILREEMPSKLQSSWKRDTTNIGNIWGKIRKT
jgi:hypothetical protein